MKRRYPLLFLFLVTALAGANPGAVPDAAPELLPITLETAEDTLSPWVALTPHLPHLPAVTLTVVTPPAGGQLELDGAHRARFRPQPDWHGDTTFRLRACHPDGRCHETEHTLRVSPTADPPQLPAVSLTSAAPQPSPWFALPISDPDEPPPGGHRLELVNPPPPTHGVVEVDGERVRFVPAPGWTGVTRADLAACHADGRCGRPTPLTLQVLADAAPPACDAPLVRVQAGEPATTAALDATAAGDPRQLSIPAHAPGLTVQVTDATQLSVQAPATARRGDAWYLLEVCADADRCTTCRGTVRIETVNHPPRLSVPSFVTDEDTPSRFLRPSVADADPGDDWRLELVTPPPATTGVVQTLGKELRFKPAPDWHGTTEFTLRVCDAQGACSAPQPAPVTVRPVNDAPTLPATAFTLAEDQAPAWFPLPVVDPDSSGPFQVAVVAQGAGVVAAGEGGRAPRLRLTPRQDATGTALVTLRLCDDAGACAPATVTVTLQPVNDPPVAASGTLLGPAGATSAWLDVAVLDPDAHDTHRVEIVTPLDDTLGALEVRGRRVRVQAPAGAAGRDTAGLRVCDAAGDCSPSFPLTVEVTPTLPACAALQAAQAAAAVCAAAAVPAASAELAAACWQAGAATPDSPPAADTLLLATGEDEPSPWVPLPWQGADCACPDDGCPLELVTPPPPAAGTLELAAGRLRFVPAPDWSGTAAAQVRACAPGGACQSPRTVALLVTPQPDAPRVPAGLIELTLDDQPAPLAPAVLTVDPGTSATDLRFRLLTTAAASDGVALTASGALQRDAALAARPLEVTHLLQVCAADERCTVTHLRLRAADARPAPRLTAPPWVVTAGSPDTWHPFDLQSADPDAHLQLELLSSTLPGTVAVNGAAARLVPTWGWTGEGLTRWRACDDRGHCSEPVAVPVQVVAAPDAPAFNPVTLATREDIATPWLELAVRQAEPRPPYTLTVDPPPSAGAVLTDGARLQYVPAPDASGEDAFGLVLCDAAGRCARQPGQVRVQAVNDPPQTTAAPLLTAEDQSSPWRDLTPADPDPAERHTLEIRRHPPLEAGTVEVADLQLRFHPAPHWFGATALSYRVCDAAAACSADVELELLVTPVGDAPRPQPAEQTTREDTPSDWWPLPIDDDDPEDQHDVTLTAVPAGLTVQVRDRQLQVSPDPDVAGAFAVGLTVCDRYQRCTPTTLPVRIDPVADSPQVEELFVVHEQGTPPEWLTPTLRDPDVGDQHHLELLGVPDQGQAEVKGAQLRYLPAPDFLGETVLAFRACDQQGLCSPPARAVLRVVDHNDPPHLAALQISVAPGETAEVRVDYSDPDADETHVLRLRQEPGFGTATLSDNRLRYTAPAEATGATELHLELCDQKPQCVARVVPITLLARNQAPVLAPLTLLLPAAPAPAPWVRAVIEDPDAGDEHRLEVVTPPRHGRVELQGAELRYQAAPAFSGEERLTLRACDAQDACSPPAPVTVRATPAADGDPLQVDDSSLELSEDGLAPWVDLLTRVRPAVAPDTLVVELTDPAQHGQCHLSGRRLRYRPPADWSGADSCGYRVCRTDGHCSAPARLQVTVTPQPDAPRLGELTLDLLESTTQTVTVPVFDADEQAGHRVTVVESAADLTLVVSGLELEVTPRPTFSGDAPFTLQACDAGGLCSQRAYTVTVLPLPDAPRLTPLTLEVEEDTATGPVAVPIVDADANERYWLQVLAPPEHGQVTVAAGSQPTLTYTPHPDYAGNDDLLLQVCDQHTLCNEMPVTVRVAARNDPPQAVTLVLRTHQDTPVPFTRPAVTDPDRDDRHQLSVVTPPQQATVELGTDLLSLRALPRPGFTGRETFTVRVCDLSAACVDAAAELEVLPLRNPADTLAILPTVAVVGPSPEGRWPLVTTPLTRRDTGERVTGKHPLTLRYAADGRANLRLGTATLVPGGTLTVPDYDFDAAGGRIALALALDAPATAPDGVIGMLTLRVEALVTEDIGVQLATWNPARLLAPQPPTTVVARDVQRLDIPVADLSGYCAGTVLTWTSAAAFPRRDRSRGYCAVEWLDLPPGLEPDRRAVGASLTGRVTTPDPVATLVWRAGLVFFDHLGLPRFFPAAGERRLELQVIAPPLPELLFRPDATAGVTGPAGGYWPLPATAVAQVSARAPYPGLTLTLDPVGGADPEGIVVHSASTTVQADVTSARRPQTYRLTAAYSQAPAHAATAQLTLGEPGRGSAVTLHGGPTLTQRADEALVIHGALVDFAAPDRPADEAGRWRVQLMRQQAGGPDVAVGPEIEAGAAPFTLTLPPQAPGEFLLFAEALDAYGTGQRVHSAPLRVILSDPAAAPAITLDADLRQGQAPLATTLTARLPAAALAQVAAVAWERAPDPDGAYQVIATTTAPELRLTLPLLVREPGVYHYRLRVTPRGGGPPTYSPPLTVQAYQLPPLRIHGYPETVLGRPVQWAVLESGADAIEYQWTSPALVGSAQGASVQLAADQPGRLPVTVRAKYVTAPDLPAAWATWTGQLLVAPPFLRAPTLSGPYTVYEGQVARFHSPQEPVVDPAAPLAPAVRRLWRLPNGRVATGDSVVYTVGADDAHIDYSAWLDGHEATTRVTSRLPLHTHARPWPRWQLQRRPLRAQTPARVYYALVPETPAGQRDLRLGQDLRYDLDLPAGVTVLAHDRHTALLQFDAPGPYAVRFTVTDAQGRQQTVEDRLTIADPPPLLAAVRTFFADRWQRAPLDTTLRWSVEGLAAGETVTAVQLLLDGELAQTDPPATAALRLMTPGQHEVVLRVRTSQGRSVAERTRIQVQRPAPPRCQIEVSGPLPGNAGISAVCTTPLGRVGSYHWRVLFVDGGRVELKNGGQRFQLAKADQARAVARIELVARDDQGHAAPVVTWAPEARP